MPDEPCPRDWEYEHHPDYSRLLPVASDIVLTGIQAGRYPVRRFATDTRPIHGTLFKGLTPAGRFDYFAGNYRGSHHRCLKDYEVGIPSDSDVGTKTPLVLSEIDALGKSIVNSVTRLEAMIASLPNPLTPAQRAAAAVKLSCSALVSFFTIHPYANGNGHVGRSLLWILLMQFKFVPSNWTIDPRPAIPNYDMMIAMHRRGQPDALEQYVLQRISLARPPS